MPPKINPYEDSHVIVASDKETYRRQIGSCLASMGFNNVDIVDDGEEVLNILGEGTDLLITDIGMRPMDGIQLLKSIREAYKLEAKRRVMHIRKGIRLIFEPMASSKSLGKIKLVEGTGEDRTERIISVKDNLPVIILAASLPEDTENEVIDMEAEFINKPLRGRDIKRVVRKVLRAPKEHIREKYRRFAESLEAAGREILYELGDHKKKSVEPFRRVHSDPLSEFYEKQPSGLYMNTNVNWATNRTAADVGSRWRMKFASLMKANYQHCCDLHLANVADDENEAEEGKVKNVLVCELGLGSGFALNSLRHIGIPKDSLVSIANKKFFELPDLLKSTVKDELISDNTLMEFIDAFSVEFLNQKGMNGLLTIQLGVMESESRLRQMLKDVNVNAICSGELIFYPQIFAKEQGEKVLGDVQVLFEEYQQSPKRFFEKYFKSELMGGKLGSLQEFATVYGDHILPADFRDIGNHLPEAQMFGPVYGCRSLSHLSDAGYYNTVMEMLSRMLPSAIWVDDGYYQSYSEHQRVGELVEIKKIYEKKYGCDNEYRLWVCGDENSPYLYTIFQRGVPNGDGTFSFWDGNSKTDNYNPEHDLTTYMKGAMLVPAENYIDQWPEDTLLNYVIKSLRGNYWQKAYREIASEGLSIEFMRFWLEDKLEDVYRKLQLLAQSVFESNEWQQHKKEDSAEDFLKWMKQKRPAGSIYKLAKDFLKLKKQLEEDQVKKMDDEAV